MEITVGVFAGIFNESGKLLLRRREEGNSIISSESNLGEWELPGGTVEEENVLKTTSEFIGKELAREVEEETGLLIEVALMPAMFPAVYVTKEKKMIDIAFMIPVGIVEDKPTKSKTIYVSPKELGRLDGRSKNDRIVSGWGKRMCRMALMALCYSPSRQYRKEARKMLSEIQIDNRRSELQRNSQ
jgi:8-oxo-dGTP pyrophosphatase MutT (NUDIX family)